MKNFILALNPALLPLEQATQSLGGTSGPDLTAYFQVCGLLLVVIAVIAIGMRKLLAGGFKTRASQRSLQVIDVLNLGGRRKIAVVRCYDRTFVLGMGEKEIAPIAELDPVIGSEQKTIPSSKSDDEAFAHALEQVQASMPQEELMAKLLEAQDQVSPSLAKKMRRPQPPMQTNEVVVEPAATSTSVPQAPLARTTADPALSKPKAKVQKKRVRRKVVKKSPTAESPRRIEANAVASAAFDMAAAKRQSKVPVSRTTEVQSNVQTKVNASTPAPSPTEVEPPILRMEGILG